MHNKNHISDNLDDYIYDISAFYSSVNDVICNKNKYAQMLSKCILKAIRIVRLNNSNTIYIYSKFGYYVKAEPWLIPSITKRLIESINLVWTRNEDKDINIAIIRDCTNSVCSFNSNNSINLKNGVFNLTDGSFEPHNPENSLFTYVLDYEYNPIADCPIFKKFIKETTCNDDELESVLQEILGYTLSIDVKAEKAFFFYGKGCNGKSLLASIINHLVGIEQVCAVSLSALSENFGMSSMIGKRVNIASENETLPNSERLKSLISCDRMNIPVKYKDDWSGVLFTKQIFLMNNLPQTNDLSHGFFRKIMIIPFNNNVSSSEIDVTLKDKLLSELSGIFNWAYLGYKRLVKQNYVFTSSKAIDEVIKYYMTFENPTNEFFNDNYIKNNDSVILKSQIYEDYIVWCNNMGYEIMNRQKFHNALKLKSMEDDSTFDLKYVKRQGIYYLVGYKKITEE